MKKTSFVCRFHTMYATERGDVIPGHVKVAPFFFPFNETKNDATQAERITSMVVHYSTLSIDVIRQYNTQTTIAVKLCVGYPFL